VDEQRTPGPDLEPGGDTQPPMPPSPVEPPVAPPVAWSQAPAAPTGIPVPGSPGVFFAGMWPRFAAFVLDAFLLIILNILVLIVVSIASAASREQQAAISGVAGALLSAAYFIPLWRGDHRATFGMRALGIQLGNAFDGVRLTDRQALIRWAMLGYPLGLVGAIPNLGGLAGIVDIVLIIGLFLTTLGSTTRQGWHDQLANSAVVRRPGSTASNSTAVVIVLVLLLLLILPVFALIGLYVMGSAVSQILSTVGNSIQP